MCQLMQLRPHHRRRCDRKQHNAAGRQLCDCCCRRVGVAKYSRLRQEFQEKEDKMREVRACRNTSAARARGRWLQSAWWRCCAVRALSNVVCRRWTR